MQCEVHVHWQKEESLLAVHEAQTPVWRHDRAANDGSQLVENSIGSGAHQEVEVQHTTSYSPLHPCLCQHHIHGIAVEKQHTMCCAICKQTKQSTGPGQNHGRPHMT